MRPPLRALRLAAVVALSASCNSNQPTAQAEARQSAIAQVHKAPSPSAAGAGTGTAPAESVAAQSVSREQVVNLMLEPGIRAASPEETARRLSPLGEFTRSSMFPDQLDLRNENVTRRVLVEYVQGKTGFLFADLRVAFFCAPGAELKAAYDAIDEQLAKKLGKPQWIRKVPESLPSRAYRVDKSLTVVLGEGLEKGRSFVRLELGEPQGEGE